MDRVQENKAIISKLQNALYNLDDSLSQVMDDVFAQDAEIHLSYPFEDMRGPSEYYQKAYAPLIAAIPDLERRDFIVIGGPAETGDWVGCVGYYFGVFENPWLDIPPTMHPVHMRYHEFYRIENGKIVEMQAIWDVPEVMIQARAWPLSPGLGRDLLVPGPATCDGRVAGPWNETTAGASQKLVRDMLNSLGNFKDGGHEAMDLGAFWHPKMTWYGPAGIGTNRRISGFRNWHQIPFLKAMPDRVGGHEVNSTEFGDGEYVGFTAWPGMRMTLSDDGWLGIAPSGKKLTMRSLDFWRCEDGLIRENWVLVDLLDVYNQIGVDVFSRMREYTVDRQLNRPKL